MGIQRVGEHAMKSQRFPIHLVDQLREVQGLLSYLCMEAGDFVGHLITDLDRCPGFKASMEQRFAVNPRSRKVFCRELGNRINRIVIQKIYGETIPAHKTMFEDLRKRVLQV